MCSHWTEAKLFKFLRFYKRYECLWNPYSPGYGSSNAKSKAFSQILSEMNVFGLTVNECLNQLKHIRETYKLEQQRLESIAFLGGSSYSNLLWYPLMKSMLSKVIKDEEKLNQATGNPNLIITPERLPVDSGDQRSQRDFNQIGYGQRTFSWDPNQTRNICPYLPSSNFEDYGNCYPNSNNLNKSVRMCAMNEHIGSCPTCGYSNCDSCNCFLMDAVGYCSDYIGQSYSSQSEINYRPRTSYNYRNGMLEINSAVRIPVSQPSPSYGYSNLIESIIPEESEYLLNPILTNHQPEIETIKEGEQFPIKCCAKSSDCNNIKNNRNKEYKFQKILDHVADNTSNPLNLSANENINWSSKKSEKTKKNVDDIQNFLGSISVAQNSICKSTKHENSVADNSKSLRFIDQGNQTNDILQHSQGVESKKLFDIEEKIVMPSSQQQSIVNIKAEKSPKREENMTKADVKVEQTLTVASGNEQPVEDDIPSKTLRIKAECNENIIPTPKYSQFKNCQTNRKLNSVESVKTKAKCGLDQQSLPAIVNNCKEEIYDADTAQGMVQRSNSIIKNNLTKMVIDFIDESLNKPEEESSVDAKERLVLKKVAKDLQAMGNESNCDCNDESVMENYHQLQENGKLKFRKKTICWREPIVESLNIAPCKFIRNRDSKTTYREDVLAERPLQLNKGTTHRSRMMGGADFDFNNDTKQSNLFRRMDTQLNGKTTTISPNFGEHSVTAMNNKQQHNDGKNSENVSVVISNEATSQTNPAVYVLGEVSRSISNPKVVRHENCELVSQHDIESKYSSVFNNQFCQAKKSIDLDSQSIEIDGKILKMVNNLDAKSYENEMDDLECSGARSTLQDVMGIKSSVTINISVQTSKSTETELIDKVVNKITHVLRKTLHKNGYAIEKKQFFSKKNLITNDNGEINQKLIGNEAVWRTELKSIVGHLMKHEKAGDSITFKVKTMILPVSNRSYVTPEGVTNLTSAPNIKQKLDKSVEGPDETESKTCNKRFKDPDCDILFSKSNRDLQVKKQLLKDQTKRSCRRSKHVIPSCILENKAHRDKVLMNDAYRIVSPCKNDLYALRKLLKYLVKFRNKFQTIPKKHEKLLRDKLRGHKHTLTNDTKFEKSYQNRDFVAANLSDKLPYNGNEDIDVYLCTEISQETQSSMQIKTSCDYYSDSSIPNDVHKNSPRTDITIPKDIQISSSANNCMQQSEIKSVQDVSERESFSDSHEEVSDIVKSHQHRNNFSRQSSKRQPNKIISAEKYGLKGNLKQSNRYSSNNYSLVDTSYEEVYPTVCASHKRTRSTFWDQKYAKQVELLDTMIQPTDKEYSMPSEANALKYIPNLRNSCKIIDIFSSDKQNMSRKELRISEESSKASLRCTEFDEAKEENKDQMPSPSESEEGHSLLEAKLGKVTDNHIESCCTRDKTRSICAPICNVNSRLRLCAIMRSPNETSRANYDISTSNICCCNELDKLKNLDGTFSKPSLRASQKNVMTGNGSVRSSSCQTDTLKRDLNILEQDRDVWSQEYRENLKTSFPMTCNEAYTENSATEDTTMKQLTVQSNIQNSVSTSLDIAALGKESLILEIKMLQPLFSIEVKKGRKDSGKAGATVEQESGEFLEQDNHDVDVYLGKKSVMEPNHKDSILSPQQQSINCINKNTSANSINFGIQETKNQETELLVWKNKEGALSCETQTSQICIIETNSEKRIEVFSNNNASPTSIASNELKKNALTSCEEECDSSDPGQCNMLLEMSRSLEKYPNLGKISTDEFSAKDSKAEAIPQPNENCSGQTKSITIETLISTLETSLRHITDPIIYQNFADTIKYIKDQEQNQNYPPSEEIYFQDQACGSLEQTLQKSEIESEDHIRPQSLLSISNGSQCQKPCKSQTVVTADSSKNVKILQDRNTLSLQSEEAAGNSQTKMDYSKGPTLTKEEVANQIFKNELQRHSRLMSPRNYSSNEISSNIEEIEVDSSCYDPSTNEGLNVTPQLQYNEDNQSSKNYCCHGKSTAVDINAFASMLASQLRGLSTEAALRSQQRIQTLISKSRLESEQNRKHR